MKTNTTAPNNQGFRFPSEIIGFFPLHNSLLCFVPTSKLTIPLKSIRSRNIVEQDHQFIKRCVKPGMGFFAVETAGRTLQGYEMMHMIRKGQMRSVEKGAILGQVAFIHSLFGVAA